MHSGVKFNNVFQQETAHSCDPLWTGLSLSCFYKDALVVLSPSPRDKERRGLEGTGLSLGLFSVHLNYGGREDKNTMTKNLIFLHPEY